MFKFTVGLGNANNDLDYTDTTALILNGGSIRDVSGNNASLNLIPPGSSGSLSANKNLVIDGAAPVISSVTSSTLDSTYIVGDTIAINIVFSEIVTVTGAPTLTLETGQDDAVLYYNSGTGTSTLGFEYIVASGHLSSDLNYIDSSAFSLNGGTVRDLASNDTELFLPRYWTDLLKKLLPVFLSKLKNWWIKSIPFKNTKFLCFVFFSNSMPIVLSIGKPKSVLFWRKTKDEYFI